MINRHILSIIDLRLETKFKRNFDENGHVKELIVTDKKRNIECELVGLTAGVSPNVDF
jgi:hypothetical protein